MNKRELARVENLCREAIARALEEGREVVPGLASSYLNFDGIVRAGPCGCLLGNLGHGWRDTVDRSYLIGPGHYFTHAAKVAGLSLAKAKSLECGFMGWDLDLVVRHEYGVPDQSLFELGQQLRDECLTLFDPETMMALLS